MSANKEELRVGLFGFRGKVETVAAVPIQPNRNAYQVSAILRPFTAELCPIGEC